VDELECSLQGFKKCVKVHLGGFCTYTPLGAHLVEFVVTHIYKWAYLIFYNGWVLWTFKSMLSH